MSDFPAQPGVLSVKKLELLRSRLKQKGINVRETQTIPLRKERGPCALSFAQQRLWFLEQLEPGTPTYNIPGAIRLTGTLNVLALEQGINEMVQRHEVLRTTFTTVDGQPVQLIAPGLKVPLPVIELCDVSASQQHKEIRCLAAEEGARPFDLAQGPVLRAHLLRVSNVNHVLLLTIHHIACDGWSLGVLVRELSSLYAAFTAGQPSPLPDLPVQYADFALWQRDRLNASEMEVHLAYWRKQLAGAPAVLELPTDRPRPAVQTWRGSHYAFDLPGELARAVAALSRQEGVTPFMTLVAALVTLLWRYSGQEDIVIGTSIANRRYSELEGLIGCFVNTLALRSDLSSDPSFLELLQQVREVCLAAYAHQDLPFEKLVEELAPERSLSHSPLFQVMFELQNASNALLDLPGLTLRQFDIESGTAKFDLLLSIAETEQGFSGIVEYNTDLFEETTIRRMAAHLHNLLAGIVHDPQQQLAEIPLLSDAEREQQLVAWNASYQPYPYEQCLTQLFEAQVERTPEAIVVSCGDEQLTYRELNRQANRLAYHLRERGIGPEALVALLGERGCDFLTAILGVFKAGGAYLPLDPLHPPARLRQVVERSGCTLLLVMEEFSAASIQALKDDQPGTLPPFLHIDKLLGQAQSEENLPAYNTPRHLAYVIYTSGSTGLPKGAMVEQRGMVNHLYAKISDLHLTGVDTVAQTASQCFDISVWQFLAALLVGGRVQIYPDAVAHDLLQLLPQVEYNGVTILETVPSFLRVMIESIETGGISRSHLERLRWLIPTGEALPPELCVHWLKAYPHISLLNAYGPTECSDDVTHFPIYQPLPATSIHTPIGRPVGNMRLYILDRKMLPVPAGVHGELYVGGVGVGRGYLGDSQLTAGIFVPDPFSDQPGARLYRTGDLARHLPDGNIEFLGRVDYQVKVRGYRIEPGEIEAVLSQHPDVRDVVVWVHEALPGDKRLTAYIVLQPAARSTIDELRQYLQKQVPGYMVPSAFVVLDALPLTPNGKIDYHALPVPGAAQPDQAETFAAPRSYAEEILVGIWAELLGVKQISIHDNFFELGGDSILSIQVIARALLAGLHLSPRQLFQYQTIAALAAAVDTVPIAQVEQGIVSGLIPLTPIQCWFFEQQFADPHHFNQTMLLSTRPSLNLSLLEQAVQYLQQHHDALRMRFKQKTAGWQQVNLDDSVLECVMHIDLAAVPPHEQKMVIESTDADLQSSLNLAEGPLLRIAYFDPGPRQPGRLLLVIHHLMIDAVSWRILLTDLQTAYRQLEAGELLQLPPKTTSFQQWARRLQGYAHAVDLQQELAYWLAEPRTRICQLPLDNPGGANTQTSARSLAVTLSSEETQALLQEVPAVYHTQINDLLLTALVQACAQWTGSRQFLVDMETHGREEIIEGLDVSRTVGWFTALYPVLLDLEGIDGPGEAIMAIKEQLRRVPNRGIGYGILRYLSREPTIVERLCVLPQAEISFNYLGQVERATAEIPLFGPAEESTGLAISQRARRSYLLDINGLIADNQLRVEWTYSEHLHHRATIEKLAERFLEALRLLIAHCQSPNVGGYTPSDFPQARLSQKALDKLIAKVGQANRVPLTGEMEKEA